MESLTAIHISGGALPDGPVSIAAANDTSATASSILGSNEGVTIELTFAEQSMPMFTEGMSEVDKLKAKRRSENAAKCCGRLEPSLVEHLVALARGRWAMVPLMVPSCSGSSTP